MVWDQLYLNSIDFLKDTSDYTFEFMIEELLQYSKTVFIPFNKINTTLTIQEQINLVASSGLCIAILRTLDGKKSLGFIISKNNQEVIAWYNIYQAISREALDHRIQ